MKLTVAATTLLILICSVVVHAESSAQGCKQQYTGMPIDGLKEFEEDFSGESFQENKELRVKQALSENPRPDAEEELSGDYQEVIIVIKKDSDEKPVLKHIHDEGGDVIENEIPYYERAMKIKVLKSNKIKFIERIKLNPNVEYVEPVRYYKLDSTPPIIPDDPYYPNQWIMAKFGMANGWAISQEGKRVRYLIT